MDRIIREEGFEARKLTWQQLAWEAGLEGVTERTISRVMGNTMEYTKCIACQKSWCNTSTAKKRKEWSGVMKERYPDAEDWYHVRFLDEVHWAIRPEGSIYIICKPGERYCKDCIQYCEEKDTYNKSLKRVHAWGAVGYDFKLDLTFYNI
ncbi:hypothetical protein M3J09_005509 [Ascochyta lentis]